MSDRTLEDLAIDQARAGLTPERRAYIDAALEHAEDFPDAAFWNYVLNDCDISVEELEAGGWVKDASPAS